MNKSLIIFVIILAIAIGFNMAWGLSNNMLETPEYELIKKNGSFEIRKYENDIQEKFEQLFLNDKTMKKRKKKNIDDHGVISNVNNPLTVEQDVYQEPLLRAKLQLISQIQNVRSKPNLKR